MEGVSDVLATPNDPKVHQTANMSWVSACSVSLRSIKVPIPSGKYSVAMYLLWLLKTLGFTVTVVTGSSTYLIKNYLPPK